MGLLELHLTECHESSERDLKDFGGQPRTRRKTIVHQRIQSPSSRHVVRHRQRRCEVLLDEEVEDFIRVRSRPAEDPFSKRLGRSQRLEGLWVRIANDVEHLRPDSRHLVLRRDSKEGGECGEIGNFIPLGESVARGDQRNDSSEHECGGIRWKIYDLQKCSEIRGCVRGRNAGAAVG